MTNILPVASCDASTLTSSIQMSADAPIGLFDSGIGGLSVYLHLQELLPNEHYVYYADTLHMPYGARSQADIIYLTLKAVKWLVDAGCKIIVLACNSASAHALDVARRTYPNLPIVGLVPALKPAVLGSQTKRVAVLATQATLDGKLLNDVIENFATPNGVQVVKWFDPELVPWVELGMNQNSLTAKTLVKKLHDFAKQNIDYLVLGCTHYPFFKDFLANEVAQCNLKINIIDSGAAVALRVYDVLLQHNALSERNTVAELQCPKPLTLDIHIGVVSNSFSKLQEKCPTDLIFDPNSLINRPKNFINKENLKNRVFDSENASISHHIADHAKLMFFVTDPNTLLVEISIKVRRLLHRQSFI